MPLSIGKQPCRWSGDGFINFFILKRKEEEWWLDPFISGRWCNAFNYSLCNIPIKWAEFFRTFSHKNAFILCIIDFRSEILRVSRLAASWCDCFLWFENWCLRDHDARSTKHTMLLKHMKFFQNLKVNETEQCTTISSQSSKSHQQHQHTRNESTVQARQKR